MLEFTSYYCELQVYTINLSPHYILLVIVSYYNFGL